MNDIHILFKNGRLRQGTLKKDWYIKNKKMDVYERIFKETSFLNDIEGVTLRERIFYIQKDIKEVQKCQICNDRKRIFDKFKLKFKISCSDISCISKIKSENTKKMHSERSDLKKK